MLVEGWIQMNVSSVMRYLWWPNWYHWIVHSFTNKDTIPIWSAMVINRGREIRAKTEGMNQMKLKMREENREKWVKLE